MAITIDNYPSSYQSFNDDLWFVVSSNNTGQTNFKYVFDVYISNNLVARVKSFPQPGTNKGLFNAANIVRNYWESYFRPATTKTAFNYVGIGNRINYVVKYGEEYGGTLYTNLSETDTDAYNYYPSVFTGKNAFNGDFYQNVYLSNAITKRSYDTYTTTVNNSRLFLTLQNITINTPSDWWLSISRINSGVTTSTTGGTVSISDIALLDISPGAINNYLGSTFITSATDSYYVSIINEDTEVKYLAYVTILCESRFKNLPIHFLNSLGGYDTMNFNLVNRESRNVEKKSYEEIDWQYRSNDMHRLNQYNVYYGGSKQFYTAQTINYKLTSDWLNLTDYTWLRDLIMSPEVYMEYKPDYESNTVFIPVTIGTSTWVEKKRYADKIYNLELDINIGSKEFSQFR